MASSSPRSTLEALRVATLGEHARRRASSVASARRRGPPRGEQGAAVPCRAAARRARRLAAAPRASTTSSGCSRDQASASASRSCEPPCRVRPRRRGRAWRTRARRAWLRRHLHRARGRLADRPRGVRRRARRARDRDEPGAGPHGHRAHRRRVGRRPRRDAGVPHADGVRRGARRHRARLVRRARRTRLPSASSTASAAVLDEIDRRPRRRHDGTWPWSPAPARARRRRASRRHGRRPAARAAHALDRAGTSAASRARRLGPLALQRLGSMTDRLAARRALLAAYDPSAAARTGLVDHLGRLRGGSCAPSKGSSRGPSSSRGSPTAWHDQPSRDAEPAPPEEAT